MTADFTAPPGAKVLVTGGSGYIAGFVIRQLLDLGWTVRATLRSLKREGEVRAAIAGAALDPARLSFVAADLSADAGWTEAAAGMTHVLHVASPIPPALPKHEDELIVPARDGALRVLKAARDAGVTRTVITSSTAAITYGHGEASRTVYDETHWTNPSHPDTSPYVRSKAIAERAAWDFMGREGGGMTLAAVNPAAVLGPVLGPDFSPSLEIIKKLLEGSLPGLPRFGFPLVDVRDIADLHIRALMAPQAAGERFIGGGAFYWMADVARVLKEELGPRARKTPTNKIPDFMVRLLANFDPVTKSVAFELGRERGVDSTKAQTVLGWRPRPYRDTIVDCAESLLANQIVKAAA